MTFIAIVVNTEEKFEIEYPDKYLLITESNTINKIANIVSIKLEKKKSKERSNE